jgi:hypothetical protein
VSISICGIEESYNKRLELDDRNARTSQPIRYAAKAFNIGVRQAT